MFEREAQFVFVFRVLLQMSKLLDTLIRVSCFIRVLLVQHSVSEVSDMTEILALRARTTYMIFLLCETLLDKITKSRNLPKRITMAINDISERSPKTLRPRCSLHVPSTSRATPQGLWLCRANVIPFLHTFIFDAIQSPAVPMFERWLVFECIRVIFYERVIQLTSTRTLLPRSSPETMSALISFAVVLGKPRP